MKLFIDSNSTMREIQAIYDGLIESIEHNKNEAISKMFKVSHPSEISFKQINDIVLK